MQSGLVAHTGFEPVISALRGRCPWPLDECATHARSARTAPGWGSRIRTSAYRSRVCRPTTRRIPIDRSPSYQDFTSLLLSSQGQRKVHVLLDFMRDTDWPRVLAQARDDDQHLVGRSHTLRTLCAVQVGYVKSKRTLQVAAWVVARVDRT